MAFNVIGLFDNARDAEGAARDLRGSGFDDVSFVGNNANNDYSIDGGTEAAEGAGTGATGGAVLGGLAGLLVGLGALAIPGIGPVVAAGTLATALGTTAAGAGIGAAAGGLVGGLVGAGVPEDDANVYAEGVRRGGSLLSAQVDTQDEANQVASIMDRHNVVDIDNRGQEYRQSGWSRFDANAGSYDATTSTRDRGTAMPAASMGTTTTSRSDSFDQGRTVDQTGDIRVPIVEEELRVGKRAVEGGGVRVYQRVQETPVNEQVTLRDETVRVERRPVDRAATEADFANLKEGTIDVREHDEEAIVDKQARVVEEVVIRKDVQERTENVQDTVRRTDVNVEEVPGTTRTSDYRQVGGTQTSGYSDVSGTTRSGSGSMQDEGPIERGASKAENAVERGTGLDLDRDGDVGQRDPRNNI